MARLPRKNDPDSIRARQEALGVPEADLAPWAKAAESVTGLVQIPVSVAQLQVSLDGIVQEPGSDYTATGAALTMTSPPPAGARFWAVWFANEALT